MSELILTDEEKAAATWLELDDATVGRVVKHTALQLKGIADDQRKVWSVTAAHILIGLADDANATTLKMDMQGVTSKKGELGDWQLKLVRHTPPTETARREG